MEIVKTATDWAKAEAFSDTFFILFGVLFLLASIGFGQWGKTEIAKAFIYPTLVAGILLVTIGLGLFFPNKSRIKRFPGAYHKDALAFVTSEISRAEKTMKEYQMAVYKVIPLIIILAALLIMFIEKPIWRAIGITTIALMGVILIVDINANARMEAYYEHLLIAQKKLNN